MSKPKVLVLAAGGTISTSKAAGEGYFVPSKSGEDLVQSVPGLADLAEFRVENFSRVLSSQLSMEQVYGIARRVRAALAEDPELAGVVVTHGTGAMEETSFMTDLMVDDPRPVVFTGAMRGGSDPFSDGPYNLWCAVRVAISREARGLGTLVVMNSLIHPARDVFKSHTTNVDTFHSGEFGPLGFVYPDRIHVARRPAIRTPLYTETPVFDVDLIKYVVGMDDRYVRASVDAGAAAIVVEGSGLGNVNERVAQALGDAVRRGVVVAVCSRSPFGRTFPMYGTRASAKALVDQGCLLSSLSGPKTRILLMLALGTTRDPARLQALLDANGQPLDDHAPRRDAHGRPEEG